MENLTAETSTGSSSVRESRRTAILELSIRRILHGMVDRYPYKIQALDQLLSADIDARQNISKWALTQMERNAQWLLNVICTIEAHSSLFVMCTDETIFFTYEKKSR